MQQVEIESPISFLLNIFTSITFPPTPCCSGKLFLSHTFHCFRKNYPGWTFSPVSTSAPHPLTERRVSSSTRTTIASQSLHVIGSCREYVVQLLQYVYPFVVLRNDRQLPLNHVLPAWIWVNQSKPWPGSGRILTIDRVPEHCKWCIEPELGYCSQIQVGKTTSTSGNRRVDFVPANLAIDTYKCLTA